MLNLAGRRIPCILAILPFDWLPSVTEPRTDTARSYYLEANENETGYDRLYNMYSVDEYGVRSPEMNFVVQGTSLGILVGVLWGGIVKSRVEYMNFIDRNHASKFASTYEAKKKLQDTVTINFCKGAFQWGWRMGLFTGSYVLITTSIAAYRGKSSLIEYTTAGVVTGACYKLTLGPRAMLVGAGLGGVLGTTAGIISLALLRLSGTTMEEVRYWQYNWKKNRDMHIHSIKRKAFNAESKMERMHDEMLKSGNVETQKTEEKTENKSKA